jgi:hypothetical protein
VHVFWVDERTILSGDLDGIVLLLTISNNILTYTITKQRLLDTDSAVGAVLAIAPLVVPSQQAPQCLPAPSFLRASLRCIHSLGYPQGSSKEIDGPAETLLHICVFRAAGRRASPGE